MSRHTLSAVPRAVLLCTTASLFGFGVPAAVAQIDQGAITGTVRDPQENAVSGATVTVVNTATNFSLTRQTGNSGSYTFTPLKIGNYTVTVTAPGFQTVVRENIGVSVQQTVGVNVNLQPGSVSESVTVTSQPDLQTEDASTGQVFSAKVINDTPLDGRNYVFIAQLTTGVAAPNQGFRQVAGSGDFTSNGGRVSQNNFVLDGVDNNSNMQDFLNGATYAVRPPPDALAEFKVESSDYSAELGRSTGAAINASIKSGTNSFHGSLWEYLENDRMNASDYFNRAGRTAYHQNLFGATLGGPILRDKIFFFADAQGDRISAFAPPQANYTVPTAAMRNGDFTELLDPANTAGRGSVALFLPGGDPTQPNGAAILGAPHRYLTCNGVRNVICPEQISAVAQNVLNQYPLPNQGPEHLAFNNYTVPATATTTNTTQYDLRLDYNFSTRDQTFGRYSYSNTPTSYTAPFGLLDGGSFGSTGQNSNYAKSGVFSETHIFSPTLSNEFRVGYNWLHASYLQPGSTTNIAQQLGLGGIPTGNNLGGLPQTNFGDSQSGNDAASQIGTAGYLPSDELQNVLQIIDNVNKSIGRHSLRLGINFQHVRFYGLQPPNGIGYQNFNGTYTRNYADSQSVTGSGVAEYLMDQMNNSGLSTVTPFTDLRWYYSAYAQDDWKVTPRLTLNLGLRWEYTQPIRELHNLQSNFFGTYGGFNQGTGTLLIPQAQRNFPISATLASTLAADHIGIQYTNNNYLVNAYKTNFAPRVGLAYQLDDRTVFRAGGGLFYGGLENVGLGLNLANNAPFFVNSQFIPTPSLCQNIEGAVTCPTNGQTLETGFGEAATSPTALAAASGIGTIYAQDQNLKTAFTTAYNVSFQHSITNTLTFTVSYQGNQSRHLRASYSANTYAGYVPVRNASGQDYQPFRDFSIVNVSSAGISRYDSLQTKVDKRYAHGLYFLAGYTWAHCLDDAFGPIGQSQQGGYRNVNLLGLRYDYGACTQDVRNRVTLNGQYELPVGRGHRFLNRGGVVDAVAGGWKTSLIFQAQSGNPIFITSTNQGSSYPFRVGDPYAPGGAVSPDTGLSTDPTQPQFACASRTRTLAQWFNPCAFRNPPAVVLDATNTSQNIINAAEAGLLPSGPRGRQSIVGPGFNRVDVSLFKSFAIPFHESSLQLRADGFNVLNHPSFGNPGSGLAGTTGQQITTTRFSGLIPDARVLQVAARFSF